MPGITGKVGREERTTTGGTVPGASEEVREALQHPDEEDTVTRANAVVEYYIQRIKGYYRLAQQLEKVLLPPLLPGRSLCHCAIPTAKTEKLDGRLSSSF